MRGQQFKHPRACSRGTQAAMAAATGSCSQFLDVSWLFFVWSVISDQPKPNRLTMIQPSESFGNATMTWYWYPIDGRSPAKSDPLFAVHSSHSRRFCRSQHLDATSQKWPNPNANLRRIKVPTVQAALRAVLIHSVETSEIPLSSKDSGLWKGLEGWNWWNILHHFLTPDLHHIPWNIIKQYLWVLRYQVVICTQAGLIWVKSQGLETSFTCRRDDALRLRIRLFELRYIHQIHP